VTVRLLNSDQLDLVGFTFDAGTTRLFTPNAGGGGTLTISENGTPIDSIVFANGTYTTANFVLSEDSTNNGILVVDPGFHIEHGVYSFRGCGGDRHSNHSGRYRCAD